MATARRSHLHAFTVLLLSLATGPTHAEDAAALGKAYQKACPANAALTLEPSPALDQAAAAIAHGTPLDEALAGVGYRQQASMAATITGKAAIPSQLDRTTKSLFRTVCGDFANEAYRQVGAYRTADRLYLVFARPRRSVTADDVPHMRAELLALVNAARASGQHCGGAWHAPAPPVRYSDALTRAAIVHAADMARREAVGHAGSDGSNPSERLTRAGYRWSLAGENLAAGFDSAAAVVRGWLASPDHCSNIMDARFVETGVAFAAGDGDNAPLYWAQTFAAPRAGRAYTATSSRQ